jgi:hypothetical protein
MRALATALLAAALAGTAAGAVAPPAAGGGAAGGGATLEEIIARNAAARGGLEAWRKVQTMAWIGHVEAAGSKGQRLPFRLEMQRPNQTRFEIAAINGQFTRIFDGTRGWRLRPGSEGAPESKAFSPAEVDYARQEFVVDGPLIDHEAKGVSVKLEGADMLEGRRAYRLSLKLPSGAERRLWIDAQTYLDVRYDRPATSPLKPGATVSVFYRDYASVDGLQIPLRVETGPTTGLQAPQTPDKLLIDKVLVNPPLDARAFAAPAVPRQRRALVNIGGGGAMPAGGAALGRPSQ